MIDYQHQLWFGFHSFDGAWIKICHGALDCGLDGALDCVWIKLIGAIHQIDERRSRAQ